VACWVFGFRLFCFFCVALLLRCCHRLLCDIVLAGGMHCVGWLHPIMIAIVWMFMCNACRSLGSACSVAVMWHVTLFTRRYRPSNGTPCPCSDNCGDPSLEGPARTFFDRLPSECQVDIAAYAADLHTKSGLDFSTLCAGAYSPVLCMSALMQAMRQMYHLPCTTKRVLACELSAEKRYLLRAMFPHLPSSRNM
jgi:hypothetical protein